MKTIDLIERLKAERIGLEVAENNRLKVVGDRSKIDQFSDLILTHKKALLETLQKSAFTPLESRSNYSLLDDRHSCLECSNLTPQCSCKEAARYGRWVAWIDSQWLDKKHRCNRFRVKAVRH